jgi:hypothetical protein
VPIFLQTLGPNGPLNIREPFPNLIGSPDYAIGPTFERPVNDARENLR